MIKRKAEGEEAYPYKRTMYLPSPPRHGRSAEGDGDADLENIAYRDDEDNEHNEEKVGGEGNGHLKNVGKEGERETEMEEEEEVDPLDAFMAGIHEEVTTGSSKNKPSHPKPRREDFEGDEEDPMESFLSARKNAGLSLAADALAAGYDSDEEVYAAAKAVDAGNVEYDSDDNAIVTMGKSKIEPLPPVDHSLIEYDDFAKQFYEEHPQVTAIPEAEILGFRQQLGIRVSGFDVPRPVQKFEHAGFDAPLLGAIAKQGYEKPTPIQAQAWPIILSGRDVIGVAKTGSGKTAAFVLPMIVHIMDQPEVKKGEGPIGLILAPTRELAQQIYTETKKFGRAYGLRVSGVYGGMSKFEQFKELKAGCEVVVATPGRLIDMIKMKAVSLMRTTYLVLDEADHMLDLGFEPQVRSVVGQIRPERQTLLFSATMPRKVERLARDIVGVPVRITVGEVGRANEDITQHVHVLQSDADKLPWLISHLPERVDEGEVLVFASTKVRVEELEAKLVANNFKVAALHGDKDQSSRMEVLKDFKAQKLHVLVATDVAARGLDIKSIKSVINYDMAKDMDSYVHRIGRTGRAGDKSGVAFTLVTQKEARMAGELLQSLIAAGQIASPELMELAMKDGRFRTQKEGRPGKGGRGKGGRSQSGGGGGRGQRGVDFGLGLGYASEPKTSTAPSSRQTTPLPPSGGSSIARQTDPPPPPERSVPIPSRGTAMGALKTGMMMKFKSSFVAASSAGASASYNANAPTGNATPVPAAAPQGPPPGSTGLGLTPAALAAAAQVAAVRAAAEKQQRAGGFSGGNVGGGMYGQAMQGFMAGQGMGGFYGQGVAVPGGTGGSWGVAQMAGYGAGAGAVGGGGYSERQGGEREKESERGRERERTRERDAGEEENRGDRGRERRRRSGWDR